MKTVDLMIDLLDGLYDLNDKIKTQYHNNAAEIERAFDGYAWEDIRRAINYYYVRKNDKVRPTIAKILAVLETDPKTERLPTETDYQEVERPQTRIFEISRTHNKLVDLFAKCRLIDTGEYTKNTLYIVDINGNPLLDPKNQLKYQVEKAMMQNIVLFQKYGRLSLLEALAICIDNDLLRLYFCDTKQFLNTLPSEIRVHVRGRDEKKLQTALNKWGGKKNAGVFVL